MAKATIKFDLNDPEDRKSHMRCLKSTDMACALFEIHHNIKKRVERSVESSPEIGAYNVLDMYSDLIDDEIRSHNINLDELID